MKNDMRNNILSVSHYRRFSNITRLNKKNVFCDPIYNILICTSICTGKKARSYILLFKKYIRLFR